MHVATKGNVRNAFSSTPLFAVLPFVLRYFCFWQPGAICRPFGVVKSTCVAPLVQKKTFFFNVAKDQQILYFHKRNIVNENGVKKKFHHRVEP